MTTAIAPETIAADARWLVQGLDPDNDLVRIVAMAREDYREASFLDQRMFGQVRDARIQPWADIQRAASLVKTPPAQWIFHIGHVGSTLLARLLGELPGLLSIREPGIFRDLFALPAEGRQAYAEPLAFLFSRRFAGDTHVVVKATSFVSELAPVIASGSRSIFMHVAPRRYIGTILAGENSRRELAALAGMRSLRMAKRFEGTLPHAQSEAGLAALAWACEITALEAADKALDDGSVLWVDFDEFLARPADTLADVAGHIDFSPDSAQITTALSGPIMRRYSKDMRYEYSAGLRSELLNDAERRFGRDIDAALAMLNELATRSPYLKSALARALTER